MSEVELESCPWPECGQYYPVHDRFGTKHTYVCYGCGARGPLADTVEEARRLWNTLTARVAALEGALGRALAKIETLCDGQDEETLAIRALLKGDAP